MAGAALVSHPLVNEVAFPGSPATAKHIMTAAAATLKNITLETGGKSPFIAFSDYNFEQAIRWSHLGIMSNQGQICTTTSRILLQDDIYDKFVNASVAEVKKTSKVGSQWGQDVYQGPQMSKLQRERMLNLIEAGRSEAKIVTGGNGTTINGKGFFVEPTVFVDAKDDARIWRQEIFGPVVVIKRFSSEEEAIQQANDTIYGLGSAVFTKDLEKTHRVAEKLEAGMV